MTIFTVNAFDDDYFDNPILKEIMKSWKYLNCPIKIFTRADEDVKKALQLAKEYISLCENRKAYSFATDPIRLYILSKYKDYLYLDTDVLVLNNKDFIFDFFKIINLKKSLLKDKSFAFLYSGDDNFVYRKMFEHYMHQKNIIKDSKFINLYCNEKINLKSFNCFRHLNSIDFLYTYPKNIYPKKIGYINETSNINNIDYDNYKKLFCSLPFIKNKINEKYKSKILDISEIKKYNNEFYNFIMPYFMGVKI